MKPSHRDKAANGTPARIPAALDPKSANQRVGFMKGKIEVPDDFDTMGATTILRRMSGQVDSSSGRGPR